MIRRLILLAVMALSAWLCRAQPVPASDENIPWLVTFGARSQTSWGDDDFCQTFFFVVPKSTVVPIYIRVFDPDCSGAIDEARANSTPSPISPYGGKGCISDPDRARNRSVATRSGNLLATRDFGADSQYDRVVHLRPLRPELRGGHARIQRPSLQSDRPREKR